MWVEGVKRSTTEGVTASDIGVLLAASTACDSDGKVMTAGKRSARLREGGKGVTLLGLWAGEDFEMMNFCLGGDCDELKPPPNEPNEPESLRAKLFRLLCVADDLLDVVECDHLLRLPIPSLMPLLGRL